MSGQTSRATALAPGEDALRRLLAGNERFRQRASRAASPSKWRERDLGASTARPIAAVLASSEMLVPPEIVFDAGPGELLVVQSPGLALMPVVVGSVEMALAGSGAGLVLVLGCATCEAGWLAEPIARSAALAAGGPRAPGEAPRRSTRMHVCAAAIGLRRASGFLDDLALGDALRVIPAEFVLPAGEVTVLAGARDL